MLDELRRVYQALRREIRAAGPGSVSRAQRTAGVGENYLRHLRLRLEVGKERGFDLGVLLRMLDALRVGRREFFAGVFAARDPVERLCQEAARLGQPPAVVTKVRQLLTEQGESASTPQGELPPYIRQLDDRRFEDARQTLRLISVALDHVAAGLAPRRTALPLLAVWGSARRMIFDGPQALDEAQYALTAAYELAQPRGKPALLGDLLQRLAYVLGDRGDHRRALALTDLAIVEHTTACHRRGVGRSLVDRGMWLYYLGELPQAIAAQHAALEHLPEDERRNRFSALQGLGLYYQEIGDPSRARRNADLAAALVEGLGPWLRGKLLWLQALISSDLHEARQAECYLREVIAIFQPTHPIESALATTDLVHLQLRQDRLAEAYASARNAACLIGPLKANRLAAAALQDLTRCAATGSGLSVALVDAAARKIREGHQLRFGADECRHRPLDSARPSRTGLGGSATGR